MQSFHILLWGLFLGSHVSCRALGITDDSGVSFTLVGQPVTIDPASINNTTKAQTQARSMLVHENRARALEKRRFLRLIHQCPQDAGLPFEYDDFEGSYCVRGRNIRDYAIDCSDGVSTERGRGSCRPTEFCVDGVVSPGNPVAAYCIEIGDMVNGLATVKNDAAEGSQYKSVIVKKGGVTDLNHIVEAVVSGADGADNGVLVPYLAIRGRDVNNHIIEAPGNPNLCTQCASIGLEPFPQGLDNVEIIVGLSAPGDVADVFVGVLKAGIGF